MDSIQNMLLWNVCNFFYSSKKEIHVEKLKDRTIDTISEND